MPAKKWLLIFIILIGGSAVLASYIDGALNYPGAGQILWGGMPQMVRSLSTANMLPAAAGFFVFTSFILMRFDSQITLFNHRFGFGLLSMLYAAILIPSALWLPLTILAVEQASQVLLWVVRLILVIIALASLGLLFVLLKAKPPQSSLAHRTAIIGSLFFCLQTVIFDAILWGALF